MIEAIKLEPNWFQYMRMLAHLWKTDEDVFNSMYQNMGAEYPKVVAQAAKMNTLPTENQQQFVLECFADGYYPEYCGSNEFLIKKSRRAGRATLDFRAVTSAELVVNSYSEVYKITVK